MQREIEAREIDEIYCFFFPQYVQAIKAAKETIYIENQHIAHDHLLDLLVEAAQRGVRVVYLVPGKGIYIESIVTNLIYLFVFCFVRNGCGSSCKSENRCLETTVSSYLIINTISYLAKISLIQCQIFRKQCGCSECPASAKIYKYISR
jgi:hypothetical protein